MCISLCCTQCIRYNKHIQLFSLADLPAAVASSSSAGAVAGGVLVPIVLLTVIGIIFGIVGYYILYKKRGN